MVNYNKISNKNKIYLLIPLTNLKKYDIILASSS